MDPTGVALAVALLVTGLHFALRRFKGKPFDAGQTFLVFFAVVTVPTAAQLLSVAITGDTKSLPAHWREYIAVASVVGIGFALNDLWERFRDALGP